MDFPPDLDPKNPLYAWLNRVAKAARSCRPLSTGDIKVTAGPGGSFISLNKQPGLPQPDFHPFEIYRFPRNLRKHKSDNDGRRFKVRGGYIVVRDGEDTPTFPVYGTDAMYVGPDLNQTVYGLYGIGGVGPVQVPPSDSTLIVPGSFGFSTGGWNEFEVAEGLGDQTVEVWISLVADNGSATPPSSTITAACVGLTSDLGTNAINLATGDIFDDVWPNFPNDDPYHIYIGQVGIVSESDLSIVPNAVRGQAVILQQLGGNAKIQTRPYGDVDGRTASAGLVMRWCGTYSNSNMYWPGDVVTIQSGVSPTAHLKKWIYDPGSTSNYYGAKLKEPLNYNATSNITPASFSPDPWKLLSDSIV